MFSPILLFVGLVSISQCLPESPFANTYEKIPIDENGFQVGIYDSFWKRFTCGGALVSPNFALTAAACVANERHRLYLLKVYFYTPLDNITYSDIADVIVHKNYELYTYRSYDIAVIKLVTPVPENLNFQYGIVPDEYEMFNNGRPVKVFEFSNKTDLDHVQVSQKNLNIVHRYICTKQYERFGYSIFEDHVCAHNTSLKGCVGSLGFPLVDVRRQIIGIGTFQFMCESLFNADLPTVYTRVSSYSSWIIQAVTPDI